MSILESVVGWLAPPVCIGCNAEGATLCIACSTSEVIPFGERCWQCNMLSPKARTCSSCRRSGSPRSVWIITDYAGLTKELIQKYKFGHQRVASRSIAGLMAKTFKYFNTAQDINQAEYLIVPVPTATNRIRERGFDHAMLLAECLAKYLHLPCSKVLGRKGQSRQVGTKRSERIAQAEKSYFTKNPETIVGRNVLLIDDVITTGATLQAAAKTLRTAGARHVDALVFAKRL
jgi:competence protein ComFC